MLATVRPQAPVDPGVAVARRMAEREAARRIVLLHGLGVFEELVGLGRKCGEAGLLGGFDAVVHQAAGIADRNPDPLVAFLAVSYGAVGPAAVFLAEVVGNIGDVDAFFGEQMWQRVKAPEQIRPCAGVGGDRCLGLNIFVGLTANRDLDAGGFGESVHKRDEFVVFGLHEIFPAQDRERSILLRFPRRFLCPCLGPVEKSGPCQRCGGGGRGAGLEQRASIEDRHCRFSRFGLLIMA